MTYRQHEMIGDFENRVLKKIVLYVGIPIFMVGFIHFVSWYLSYYDYISWEISSFVVWFFIFLFFGIYSVVLYKIKTSEEYI